MLENQSKKILLLSSDPADASLLSEIAVTQQAGLEIALNASDLCSKIAIARADDSLAAIFVDVSTAAQLHQFEFAFQSKLGNSLAGELSSMTHFISGEPLSKNREVLQSPYFSFYSERKNFDFAASANFYQLSFYRSAEFVPNFTMSFDQTTRAQCFERMQKELFTRDVSAEWFMKFKNELNEVLEALIPVRYEFSIHFSNGTFRITLQSAQAMNRDQFRIEKILELGVSAIFAPKTLVFFLPIFEEASGSGSAFRFYKVEK